MRVVVDASVVVAALMADGTVRDVLLSSTDHEFFAPLYIQEEVGRNLSRIAARAHLGVETVTALIEDALQVIDLLPAATYSQVLPEAEAVATSVGAKGDEEYIDLAMVLDAPIWTLDKDFRRVKKVKTLSTRELIDLGA